MFDLAPEGRGDFQPKLDGKCCERKRKGKQWPRTRFALWYDKDAEAAARF